MKTSISVIGVTMQQNLWMRVWIVSLMELFLTVSTAQAQDWARNLFKHTNHDFGTVARGAKVEHRFALENIYLEDAHIASVRVSCGCTTPEIPAQVLKTWDKAEVIARVDTQAYLGQKDVTITVVFDKPFPAEVQLQIHCFIRSDIVVQPGAVQFGTVAQGIKSRQKVTISYAGRNDWQIQSVECANPALSFQTTEVARGRGLVTYDLLVTLAGTASPGYIRDQFNLVTNDANPSAVRVPIPVEGVVQAAITARPSPLYMGTVEAGKSITRQLVVRGTTPFRIIRIQSSNSRFRCTAPTVAGALHLLPVTCDVGTVSGTATGRIIIDTDNSATPLIVEVSVDVMASDPAGKPVGRPVGNGG
jgi:hypothetical protein